MIAGKPCVLVVEDDPVSRGFLAAALERLGCRVLAAADGRAAAVLPGMEALDLLLIDQRLPDGSGPELLRRLRAGNVGAPAIGMSAELDAGIKQRLLEAGFAATLSKPASLAALRAAIAPFLPLDPAAAGGEAAGGAGTDPVLDERIALDATGGDRTALKALRQLFAAELAALERQLADAAAGSDGLGERLHRLRASCGFCGASALRASALRLEHALSGEATLRERALADLREACRVTRIALAAAADPSVRTP